MTKLVEITVFENDTAVSADELAAMSERDIYDRGRFYIRKYVTLEEAKLLGVDMSYLDDTDLS